VAGLARSAAGTLLTAAWIQNRIGAIRAVAALL